MYLLLIGSISSFAHASRGPEISDADRHIRLEIELEENKKKYEAEKEIVMQQLHLDSKGSSWNWPHDFVFSYLTDFLLDDGHENLCYHGGKKCDGLNKNLCNASDFCVYDNNDDCEPDQTKCTKDILHCYENYFYYNEECCECNIFPYDLTAGFTVMWTAVKGVVINFIDKVIAAFDNDYVETYEMTCLDAVVCLRYSVFELFYIRKNGIPIECMPYFGVDRKYEYLPCDVDFTEVTLEMDITGMKVAHVMGRQLDDIVGISVCIRNSGFKRVGQSGLICLNHYKYNSKSKVCEFETCETFDGENCPDRYKLQEDPELFSCTITDAVGKVDEGCTIEKCCIEVCSVGETLVSDDDNTCLLNTSSSLITLQYSLEGSSASLTDIEEECIKAASTLFNVSEDMISCQVVETSPPSLFMQTIREPEKDHRVRSNVHQPSMETVEQNDILVKPDKKYPEAAIADERAGKSIKFGYKFGGTATEHRKTVKLIQANDFSTVHSSATETYVVTVAVFVNALEVAGIQATLESIINGDSLETLLFDALGLTIVSFSSDNIIIRASGCFPGQGPNAENDCQYGLNNLPKEINGWDTILRFIPLVGSENYDTWIAENEVVRFPIVFLNGFTDTCLYFFDKQDWTDDGCDKVLKENDLIFPPFGSTTTPFNSTVFNCNVRALKFLRDSKDGWNYNKNTTIPKVGPLPNNTTNSNIQQDCSGRFTQIVETLKNIGGWTDGLLYYHSYDWRLTPDQMQVRDQSFTQLQDKIESMKNVTGLKVVLTGFSYGSYYSYTFLQRMGDEWVKKYIHLFLSVAGPLEGTISSFQGLFLMDIDIYTAIVQMLSEQISQMFDGNSQITPEQLAAQLAAAIAQAIIGIQDLYFSMIRTWGAFAALSPTYQDFGTVVATRANGTEITEITFDKLCTKIQEILPDEYEEQICNQTYFSAPHTNVVAVYGTHVPAVLNFTIDENNYGILTSINLSNASDSESDGTVPVNSAIGLPSNWAIDNDEVTILKFDALVYGFEDETLSAVHGDLTKNVEFISQFLYCVTRKNLFSFFAE